jgi:hypothetical protein
MMVAAVDPSKFPRKSEKVVSYTKTLRLPEDELTRLDKLCEEPDDDVPKDCAIFDKEVAFPDNKRVAIQVVSSTQPREEPCWTQGVLFSPEGHELGCTDVGETLSGEYILSDSGIDYTVVVEPYRPWPGEKQGLGPVRVGQFTGVDFDEQLTLFVGEGGYRTFRIITYQAYNAMGLIGSEMNGVAILDEERREVLAADIAKEPSGFYGVSKRQWEKAHEIMLMVWGELQVTIREAEKARLGGS